LDISFNWLGIYLIKRQDLEAGKDINFFLMIFLQLSIQKFAHDSYSVVQMDVPFFISFPTIWTFDLMWFNGCVNFEWMQLI
jgi:hypothetical protein